LRNAIIVAGHSVLLRYKNLASDFSWALLEFQRGEPSFYIEHVHAAVELTHADSESLLIFSGGPTRADAGPRSEALSYYEVANHYGWFGRLHVARRVLIEDFARDSFENLLFGICRFREYTGRYPNLVTLVSWAFKEQRFHWHRESIGFPAERFRYAGPNNPRDLSQALRSEERAVEAYRKDPYSSGDRFRAKRAERNPLRRQHGYAVSCPELARLLAHEGPQLYGGPWPWVLTTTDAAFETQRCSAWEDREVRPPTGNPPLRSQT
jgi:hypothetical protein